MVFNKKNYIISITIIIIVRNLRRKREKYVVYAHASSKGRGGRDE